MIKVYSAKKIITMDHNWPVVTHVAVHAGKILAVGDEKCADGWGEAVLDDRLKDSVFLPGLIEAHAHVSAGGVWRYTYCGHYNRIDPDGKEWSGLNTYDALIHRLKSEAERALKLGSRSTDKLHLGRAKIFTYGAIQAGTAKIKEPGYFKLQDHGIWNMDVSHFKNAEKSVTLSWSEDPYTL